MSTIPELRELMRAELEADLGVQMNSGFADLDAGSVRSDVGFVWTEGFSTQDPAVLQGVEMHARIYLQWIEPRSESNPIDPTSLELLAEATRDSIADRRATSGWLLRLQGVGISYELQAVEAVWNAISENQYELVETVG